MESAEGRFVVYSDGMFLEHKQGLKPWAAVITFGPDASGRVSIKQHFASGSVEHHRVPFHPEIKEGHWTWATPEATKDFEVLK